MLIYIISKSKILILMYLSFSAFQMNWGMWDMPKVVCDFYIATDVICSTSSIFNLVAISIDRYVFQ